MTLRHMNIFRAVCENGCNTTKAARALHMTQPAVSLAIRELEQYYGAVLFDRIGRRLRLTDAGQHFLEHAARICGEFDRMERGLRDWDSMGILRVGASITIGTRFLPGYVQAFQQERPGTGVRVLVAPTELLEQKILTGELDLALIEGIAHAPAIASEEYMRDWLTVICPVDSDFPRDRKLRQEEFRQQKFLLRESGSGTREVFDRVTESAGFSVSPVWEAVSTTALINAVIHGLGIAVLPHRLVSEHLERGLVAEVSVEGLDFHRGFHIIRHKDKHLTSAARAFMELCRESR